MATKEIKSVMALALCICLSPAMRGQEQSKAPLIVAPDKFDQWGDVPFNDEKVHLNKIAKQTKEWPLSIVYLVIHVGQTACVGEAKSRGIRIKKYLMGLGVSSNRIVRIDAGWQKTLSVDVWIWPPELGRPTPSTASNLKPGAVILQRDCKTKYRGAN
jgi:hypothetical protein